MAGGFWLDEAAHVETLAKYLPAFVLGALTYGKAWKPGVRAAHVSLAAFVLVTAFTATGSYDWMWWADIALALFAAAVHLPIREARVRAAPVPA